MKSHLTEIPSLDALGDGSVSPQLREFVRRSLEKSADKRFTSAIEALGFFNFEPQEDSTEVLAPLIEDFASSPRTDRSSRIRALLIHSLLFTLLVTQVFLFQTNHLTHRNFQQRLLNLEGYLGFDIPPLRYLASMPEISLNKFDTVTRAIASENSEALRVWCSNYEFRSLVLNIDGDGRNLAHKISGRPKLLGEIEDVGKCLPAWVYDRPDKFGESPVSTALHGGSPLALSALVKVGYNPNARMASGESAVTGAIRSGNPLLVDALASASRKALKLEWDKTSELPLRIAIKQANLPMIDTLLAIGFSAEERDQSGRTALMYLSESEESKREQVFSYLVSRGARCSSRDDAGLSVLDHLIKDGVELPPVLLKKYCSPGATN